MLDAPYDIFDFSGTGLGLGKLERGLATKGEDLRIEPAPGVFIRAEHLLGALEIGLGDRVTDFSGFDATVAAAAQRAARLTR